MELRQYVYLVWRWLWLIISGVLLAGGVAYYVSRAQAPVYRASATLLVIEGSNGVDTAYNALLTSEQLAQSYAERLKNYEVLAEALANLGLSLPPEDLVEFLQVQLVNNTQLIILSVENTDPQVARDLANEIPAVFAERNSAQQLARYASLKLSLEDELQRLAGELANAETALAIELERPVLNQTAVNRQNDNILRLRETYARMLVNFEDVRIAEVRSLDNLVIDEAARLPLLPVRPRVVTNTLLAAVVGGMLALGLVFLVEYLDDTLKNPKDIELNIGLTTLGSLQKVKVTKPVDALVVAMEPRSPAAEAYRQIRTNIQFISVDREVRTLLITSANIGEGKTTVSINLATALAQSGKRVLLVDTDMRRPMLHRMLEVDGSKGLSNLIIRGREDAHYIKGTLIPNLYVLPAGRLPPNPAELLGSERMKEVFAWLKDQADYVIFDSPPVLAVTDAVVLSRLVDTTILVASAGHTRYPAFGTAVAQIQALDSPIAGVILNKVNANGRFGHAYNYYYRTNYQPVPEGNGRKSWKERLQTINTGFLNLFH
ncbi:MAG: polysaccharide biosynthesis tyrosine autokinase [Chloroflexi bacterium]|nr:polysaccharide biosynthesis tyrosine autokinase [Chloroflexota bacterium]